VCGAFLLRTVEAYSCVPSRAIPANAAVFYVYDVVSRQMLGKQ
jgi:hypothetical protein